MPRSAFNRMTLSGALALGVVLSLAACAAPSEPAASPSAAPETSTPTPTPYTGPAVFVGDELDLLLLTPDELTAILPGIAEVGEPSSVLEQISDGGGPQPNPAVCSALLAEQSLWSVGSRTISWTVPDTEAGIGRLWALQFADEAQATTRMDQLLSAAQQCSTFDYNGAASFEGLTKDESEHARAFAGTLTFPEIEGGGRNFHAFVSVGNVLVQLWQPVAGDGDVDADAAATLLQNRAEEARAALIEELTVDPPTTPEDPTADASPPWSEWEVAAGGMGPIRLGDPVDAAADALSGSDVVEPEYEGLPWKFVNADGTASLLIQVEEGGTTVSAITAGNDRTLEETVQDGAALPSMGGLRVGDPVADAVTALPGGTSVTVVSSGDDWYDVATREGKVFRFHADRAVTDAESVIVGITVEDATKRRDVIFE